MLNELFTGGVMYAIHREVSRVEIRERIELSEETHGVFILLTQKVKDV